MNSNLLIIAAIVLIAFGFGMFKIGQNSGTIKDVGQAISDSIEARFERDKAPLLAMIDSLNSEIKSTKDSLVSLKESKKNSEKLLVETKVRADKYVKLYRKARATNDTGAIIEACDSLEKQHLAYVARCETTTTLADSIIDAQARALFNQEIQTSYYKALNEKAERAYDQERTAHDLTRGSLKKAQRRDNAWNKWIKPVFAFAAGVFLTATATK